MNIKIIHSNEHFHHTPTPTSPHKLAYAYTKYIIQDPNTGTFYTGHHTLRTTPPQTLSDLTSLQPIQTTSREPPTQPIWTTIHLRTPSLMTLASNTTTNREYLLHCEMLCRHPHPNIAVYYGCQTAGGYAGTLMERVNPGGLSKGRFRREEEVVKAWLEGIRAGVAHLHSLGLVHNDITPMNVMFAEGSNTPVIIDLDSCRGVGDSLRETDTKQTHQWHDPRVEVAVEKNDWDAVEELRICLLGGGLFG
ncbi:hypothetical protein BO71DRAFT_446888 [Aspergillus ellipticus CBS 707.79]|uniref:EKC/KEOPS complex subunit BUD32 n=1 Tax=Aspergillus ellipticus CBS 707.79 TaxID=1448320 RepID=A0A319DXW5_9EURO|nr:hypothetical protein BO71DRAFT_446888 [Aspergillus ellipticus CBS 707.79]